jgi:Tol biopolymer transport system component
MNRLSIMFIVALLAAGLQTSHAQEANALGEKRLASAQHKATVDGDLHGAIEEYKKIVASAGSNRRLGAQALVRMAECYQKLGDAESQKIYERIVREFSDQKEQVALAQARLGGGARTALPPGVALRKVWTTSGNWSGTIAQHGGRLTYVDWRNPSIAERGTLRLRDLVTGTDRPLSRTSESGGSVAESRISRDGTQVAYHWFTATSDGRERSELRIISLQGNAVPPARRVFVNDEITLKPMDWSPDGKWIAVSVQRRDHTAQIGLVAVQDGSLRVLKSVDWRGPTSMLFSPDGRDVAFDLPETDTSDHRDVFVLAADGSREVSAVKHSSNDIVMGWSPDGTHLLFASDRSGSAALWALAFEAGKPVGAPELIKAGIGNAWSMGVSSAGALYIGVDAGDQDIEVASIDFTTGKQTAPPFRPIEHFTGSNSMPAWSYDGKSLAYISWRLGRRIIAIQSTGTGEVRELEMRPSLGYLQGLSWAPDGRSFAVFGTDLKGRDGVFRIDASTGELAAILVPPPERLSYEGFSWSPDGKRLYFHSQAGGIYERELSSGNQREVTRGSLGPISLSPDGRWIATYRSDASTKTHAVVLIPVEGGEPRELLRVSEPQWINNTAMPWTPDGRAVLVRKMLIDGGAQSELWLVPIADAPPRKLDFDAKRVPPYAQGKIRLHTDGRRLAYDSGESQQEVWVLENFLPALKASR